MSEHEDLDQLVSQLNLTVSQPGRAVADIADPHAVVGSNPDDVGLVGRDRERVAADLVLGASGDPDRARRGDQPQHAARAHPHEPGCCVDQLAPVVPVRLDVETAVVGRREAADRKRQRRGGAHRFWSR